MVVWRPHAENGITPQSFAEASHVPPGVVSRTGWAQARRRHICGKSQATCAGRLLRQAAAPNHAARHSSRESRLVEIDHRGTAHKLDPTTPCCSWGRAA